MGRDENPYANPFYAKYLNTGSQLDADIARTLESLRQNPKSAENHNLLGAMLVEKGFPKDAEREFERAVDANDDYYPAWYNLGLVRASRGDEVGARRAFRETVSLKPGHANALFQLGLVEEKRQHRDKAIELYAKAFTINPQLMDVRTNPRILDTQLVDLALLRMYPNAHSRRSMIFQGGPIATRTPESGTTTTTQEAPSPQPNPQNIMTPAAPATDPSQQRPPATSTPPAARPSRNPRPPAPVTGTPATTPTPAPPATNT
jgi:tetratricopeptide (TPR) repeat protein